MSSCQGFIKLIVIFFSSIIIVIFSIFFYFVFQGPESNKLYATNFKKCSEFCIYEFSSANKLTCEKFNFCDKSQFLIEDYDKKNMLQKEEINDFACTVLLKEKLKQVYFYKATKYTNINYIDSFPNELEYYSKFHDVVFKFENKNDSVIRTEFNLNQVPLQTYYRKNKINKILCK